MLKYIILQNILTPYRISLFDELHSNGFNFEVYYMNETEADRNWKIDKKIIKHNFYLDCCGFYKMIGRFHVHFNPCLIIKLYKQKDVEFILGGSWNDLNVMFLSLLSRFRILKNKLHFWSEANYLTIGSINDNLFKYVLRKFVFNSSNGAIIIPGKMAELTFQKWRIKGKTFIHFPNTIEEEKYNITEAEINERCDNTVPIFFLPVRLQENIKGIINFFKAVGDDNIRKGQFLIAGEGPDKETVQDFIKARRVEENIKLLGHRNTEEMASLYKKANVFVLPSFSDSSPLTLVEALIMKMPLLVSDRCGNHFEGVEEGGNGYLFNPLNPISIKTAFESMLSRKGDWRGMGYISGERYSNIFNRQVVIENFMRTLSIFSSLQR